MGAGEQASRNAQVGFLGAVQSVCVSHETGSPEPIALIPGRLTVSAISNACRCLVSSELRILALLVYPAPTVREQPEIMRGSQVLLRAPSLQNSL